MRLEKVLTGNKHTPLFDWRQSNQPTCHITPGVNVPEHVLEHVPVYVPEHVPEQLSMQRTLILWPHTGMFTSTSSLHLSACGVGFRCYVQG